MPPNMPMGSPKHMSRLLIPFILVVLFLIGALFFGIWAFGNMQDYKNNVDQKITAASAIVKQQVSSEKDKEFVDKEKSPYKNYRGPETYGSIGFQYPKTWSAYVDQSGNSIPVNGYFNPDFVPGVQSSTAYALRVQVVNQTYESEVKQLDSKIKAGKITVSPFRAPKVSSILGSRAQGEINVGQKDTKVYLPLRDKTLEISTESDQFINDFNNTILTSLTYSP